MRYKSTYPWSTICYGVTHFDQWPVVCIRPKMGNSEKTLRPFVAQTVTLDRYITPSIHGSSIPANKNIVRWNNLKWQVEFIYLLFKLFFVLFCSIDLKSISKLDRVISSFYYFGPENTIKFVTVFFLLFCCFADDVHVWPSTGRQSRKWTLFVWFFTMILKFISTVYAGPPKQQQARWSQQINIDGHFWPPKQWLNEWNRKRNGVR